MGKIISFEKAVTRIQKSKDIPIDSRHCGNCSKYVKERGIYSGKVCMVYPKAAVHDITTRHCTPENNKAHWAPKPGQLSRFLQWLL